MQDGGILHHTGTVEAGFMKNYEAHFWTNKFCFSSENNILEEKDLGICADIASILTTESSVAAMNCFQG